MAVLKLKPLKLRLECAERITVEFPLKMQSRCKLSERPKLFVVTKTQVTFMSEPRDIYKVQTFDSKARKIVKSFFEIFKTWTLWAVLFCQNCYFSAFQDLSNMSCYRSCKSLICRKTNNKLHHIFVLWIVWDVHMNRGQDWNRKRRNQKHRREKTFFFFFFSFSLGSHNKMNCEQRTMMVVGQNKVSFLPSSLFTWIIGSQQQFFTTLKWKLKWFFDMKQQQQTRKDCFQLCLSAHERQKLFFSDLLTFSFQLSFKSEVQLQCIDVWKILKHKISKQTYFDPRQTSFNKKLLTQAHACNEKSEALYLFLSIYWKLDIAWVYK